MLYAAILKGRRAKMECGAKEYKKLEKALRESASNRAVNDRWGAAKFCEGWALCLWGAGKVRNELC